MIKSKKYLDQMESEIETLLGKSSVSNLQEAISQVINLQAENLKTIVSGKTPEILVDPKVWDSVLKMVEIMPKLELFEKIANGENIVPDKPSKAIEVEKDPEAMADPEILTGNAFEERSKRIKAKLNGETTIGTKGD